MNIHELVRGSPKKKLHPGHHSNTEPRPLLVRWPHKLWLCHNMSQSHRKTLMLLTLTFEHRAATRGRCGVILLKSMFACNPKTKTSWCGGVGILNTLNPNRKQKQQKWSYEVFTLSRQHFTVYYQLLITRGRGLSKSLKKQRRIWLVSDDWLIDWLYST